jgi:hypothetical protein
MARAYDIAVAALAVGVERKWLDNLTSQHSIPGTEHLARGVARRFSLPALVTAAIVRDLNRGLGVPVGRAVELAGWILAGSPPNRIVAGSRPPVMLLSDNGPKTGVAIGDALALHVDVGRLERQIERRLVEAMETIVPRRRGRPPLKERRGTR